MNVLREGGKEDQYDARKEGRKKNAKRRESGMNK